MSVSELIYDWNKVEPQLHKPDRHIGFDDETLRDGLQSPSVCEPPVDKKIELLILMDRSEEHTSELQSLAYLVCRLLLEKKKKYACSPCLWVISITDVIFLSRTSPMRSIHAS